MSTAGRINKSTTKFVPKRKTSSTHRASSATPSLSGTPRTVAQSLPALDGISETSPHGIEQSPATNRDVFLAPRPPNSKGKGSAHPASSPRLGHSPRLAPGNALGFGPSDPSSRRPPTSPVPGPSIALSSSPQMPASMPVSSLGLGFGPSDPTASSQATSLGPSQFGPSTQAPSSPSLAPPRLDARGPSSSPGRTSGKGTAFSVGLRGPPAFEAPSAPVIPSAPPSSGGTPIQRSARSPDSRTATLPPEVHQPVASTSKSTAFGPRDPSSAPATTPSADATATPAKRPLRKPKQAAPATFAEPDLLHQLTEAVNQAAVDEGLAPPPVNAEEGQASEAEPQTQREIELEAAAAAKAKPKRGRAKKGKKAAEETEEDGQPKAKKARVTKAKSKSMGKGKGKAVASDEEGQAEEVEEGEEEDGEEAEARPKTKPKTRAPRKKGAKSAAVDDLDAPLDNTDDEQDDPDAAEHGTESDQSGSEDEYDKAKPRKRRAPRKKSVKPLFQPDSEEETEEQKRDRKAEEQAALALLPAEDVLSEYATDGSESGSDGERRPTKLRYLRKKTHLEKLRITVDPVSTTMSELATARDAVWGRESSRGRQMTQLVVEKKLQRRLQRQKMKARAVKDHARKQARARGEDVPDTDDEGNEGAQDGQVERSRAGSPAVLNNPRPAAADNAEDEMEVDGEGTKADKGEDGEDEEDDDVGELTETFYVPQMRIVDGQMVIDDASLEVDRALDPNTVMNEPREVIEETGRERMVNAATWSKHTIKTDKWTAEETEDFYDALHQWGTDFEMIAQLFPLRNRRQIKAKWTREDKQHPQRITHALMHRKKIDLDTYAEKTGQNLSGPVPDDPLEAINKLRDEQEAAAKAAGGPVYGMPTGKASGRKKKEEAEERVVVQEEEREESEEEGEDEVTIARREEEEQRLIDEEIARAEEKEKGKGASKRKTRRG